MLAAYFGQLLELAVEPEHAEPELYGLLQRALDHVDRAAASLRALLHFESELARLLGVAHQQRPAESCLQDALGPLPASRRALLARIIGNSVLCRISNNPDAGNLLARTEGHGQRRPTGGEYLEYFEFFFEFGNAVSPGECRLRRVEWRKKYSKYSGYCPYPADRAPGISLHQSCAKSINLRSMRPYMRSTVWPEAWCLCTSPTNSATMNPVESQCHRWMVPPRELTIPQLGNGWTQGHHPFTKQDVTRFTLRP